MGVVYTAGRKRERDRKCVCVCVLGDIYLVVTVRSLDMRQLIRDAPL